MATRESRRRRLKKYGIGDLRERITIHNRSITSPTFDSVSFSETYDVGVEVWASIETLDKKEQTFAGANIPPNATHMFIIRWDSTVDTENVVRFEGDLYEILKLSNPDKRNQYLELYSKLLGDESLEANQ